MNSDIITILFISTVFALFAVAVAVITVVRKYKNKIQSPTYPVEHYTTLNLSHATDLFLGKTVTRVRVSSSNNRKK